MECNPQWWTSGPYVSAVIQPFFWNEDENEVYYLMGQDVEKEGKKVSKNNWSGFGGYREEHEICPIETAIREGCVEETINLLADLATSLRNKQAVEFIQHENRLYIINLYPKNEENRCYTTEKIQAFSTTFNELKQQNLKEIQKEKSQIGWIKASEIAQKIFSYNPHYTIYEQPFSASIKLDENAKLRKCQQCFFTDINSNKDRRNCIKNGWLGFEGKVIQVEKNNHSLSNKNNSLNVQNNSSKKPGAISKNNNISKKPGDKDSLQENQSWRSGNSNFKVQNNSGKKPWDKS